MTRSAALTLLGLMASTPASAYFLMPCWPISTDRIDPIVDPGSTSSHVHQIAGGSAFGPAMDYNSTQAANCTTCFVSGDHSNYWIPALYFQHQDGSFERVPQVGSASMYYFNEQSYVGAGETVETPPEGLRMLAGDPNKRSGGTDAADEAINYKCLNYAGTPTDSKGFPKESCPDGIRAEVTYPSCWDGKNLDSDDHKSHVAYPTVDFQTGACPSTHPHHFVTIKVEFIFDTAQFADKWYGSSQPFVWSQGDPTGFGLHADYVMGWNYDLLQSAIEQCFDINGVIDNCPPFQGLLPAQSQRYANPGTCTVDSFVDEQIGAEGQTISALPGCNPVQSGPGEASAQKGCGDSSSTGLVSGWKTMMAHLFPGGTMDSLLSGLVGGSDSSASSAAPYSYSYSSNYASSSVATAYIKPTGGSAGSFYQNNAVVASSAVAATTVAPKPASPSPSPSPSPAAQPQQQQDQEENNHVKIVTTTELFTETEYLTLSSTAASAAPSSNWAQWNQRREVGDRHEYHRHQHRHASPHQHRRQQD